MVRFHRRLTVPKNPNDPKCPQRDRSQAAPTGRSMSAAEASGKYVCSICGYVYDPAEHDGVAFEALPEDWRCPRCKQPKEKFNRA